MTRPATPTFSGEVERTLNMADGCLLIVDAQEGPMPQTKFVLGKALAAELKPIVIINKIDKPGARIKEVEDELADLFLELAVHEDQLHYPVYYAVGRAGKAWEKCRPILKRTATWKLFLTPSLKHIPAPNSRTGQAVPDAGHGAGLGQLQRQIRHRPDYPRQGQTRRPSDSVQKRWHVRSKPKSTTYL